MFLEVCGRNWKEEATRNAGGNVNRRKSDLRATMVPSRVEVRTYRIGGVMSSDGDLNDFIRPERECHVLLATSKEDLRSTLSSTAIQLEIAALRWVWTTAYDRSARVLTRAMLSSSADGGASSMMGGGGGGGSILRAGTRSGVKTSRI